MKHLEDKHLCQHCGRATHRQPYLMSRAADQNVLSARTILLIVVFAAALTVFSLLS